MRLNIRKTNNYTYYSIIKDYTNIDGKRTTKIFEKLGNQHQVEERFGKIDTINEIKKYINSLNTESKEELISTLQQTISRCDIELSLIHDAFSLKFGNLTVNQRNQALEAMANISEIENLKEVLQREESQVRWLNNEVSRLTGLIPTKMLQKKQTLKHHLPACRNSENDLIR